MAIEKSQKLPLNGATVTTHLSEQDALEKALEAYDILNDSQKAAFLKRVVPELQETRKDISSSAGIFKDDPDWKLVHAQIVADYEKE
ncbi:MAG: hypothetical protein OHK0029_22610 [Armatimonadaceae bacterium]